MNTIGALGLILRMDSIDANVTSAVLKKSVSITGENGKALMKKVINASV